MAGVREYRLASTIAIAISILLVLLLVAPSWFIPEQPRTANKTEKAKTHRIASIPARNIAVKRKTKRTPAPRMMKKIAVPKTKETLPIKTAAPRQSAAPGHRHAQTENTLKRGYYVQTGAFRNLARARKMAGSLQQAGWHAKIIRKNNNLHAVLAGPLKTRKKAGRAKSRLAKQFGIRGFIIMMPDN